ncbi:hypothetical protein [Hydrogenimonas sp.]
MRLARRFLWFTLWGAAFGYIESAVVVYLREIYYPQGFSFPLVPIEENILLTETLREAATLILLWATATLSYTALQSRVAAFFILFGIWDICYYLFLKLLLDWPATLFTWDILFLIPAPWVGPVWAPLVVSSGLILLSGAVLLFNERGEYANFTPLSLFGGLAAAAGIIVSFLIPGMRVAKEGMPGPFPATLFWAGVAVGAAAYLLALYRREPADAQSLHDGNV